MTEKLFTGTLNHNQNKTKQNIKVGCKGVFLSHKCLHDVRMKDRTNLLNLNDASFLFVVFKYNVKVGM